jgi:hypothetical protein
VPRFSILNLVHVTVIVSVSCVLATVVAHDQTTFAVVLFFTLGLALWAYVTGLVTKTP